MRQAGGPRQTQTADAPVLGARARGAQLLDAKRDEDGDDVGGVVKGVRQHRERAEGVERAHLQAAGGRGSDRRRLAQSDAPPPARPIAGAERGKPRERGARASATV